MGLLELPVSVREFLDLEQELLFTLLSADLDLLELLPVSQLGC